MVFRNDEFVEKTKNFTTFLCSTKSGRPPAVKAKVLAKIIQNVIKSQTLTSKMLQFVIQNETRVFPYNIHFDDTDRLVF